MTTNLDATASLQIDRPLTLELFRAGFPVLQSKIYLSICDKMIMHDRVRGAVTEFLDHLAMASANRVDHEVRVVSARKRFAALMNVATETIAATRNVSDGTNSIAWAMPWKPGENVVLTAEAEHPNNVYPWLRLRKRGVEVRAVPAMADGAIDVDGLIAAIDSRTRVVAVACVTFAPGHRTDLHKLGEACRKKGVFLFVDGVQSAGILHHDLSTEPVDGFATSTSKGLLGLYGFGFLYVSPQWIDRLEPAYLSRSSVLQKTDDHSTMGGFDYEYQPDSRRFEVGSYNLAGAYAADASIEMLGQLGTCAIEAHVIALGSKLNEGLRAMGLHVAVPSSGPQQSNLVTLGKLDSGGHGFSSDPVIQPLSQHLAENHVMHTIRRGQLRFGLHAYNSESDIDRALEVVRGGLRHARRTVL